MLGPVDDLLTCSPKIVVQGVTETTLDSLKVSIMTRFAEREEIPVDLLDL